MHKKRPYLWLLSFAAPVHSLCSLPLSGFAKSRPEIIDPALYEPSWTPTLLRCTRLFPSGSVSKESASNAGDSGDAGSIPRLGGAPKEGNGNPLQYCCLENPVDRGAWQSTVHGSQRIGHNWAQHVYVCIRLLLTKASLVIPCCVLGNSCIRSQNLADVVQLL